MTTASTTPAFETETYPCDEIEDFEIRIYAEPDQSRHQKRYSLYAEYAPMVSGDTRSELLSSALAAIARAAESAIAKTKLINVLCQNDMLCHSTDGCELLEGADLVSITSDIRDMVWRNDIYLKQLSRMAAKGAFNDAKPKQKLDLPESVTSEEWAELGRKLEASGGIAKQYALGQQRVHKAQTALARRLGASIGIMESGLEYSRISGAKETMAQHDAIVGGPSSLGRRFERMTNAIESAIEPEAQA